jgi:hypothetical protein
VTLDDVTKYSGYEVPLYALKRMLDSIRQQEAMRAGMMSAKGGIRHGAL